MRVTIHNVGHGLCISLIGTHPPHGYCQALLWDCGRNDTFRPSQWLVDQGVVRLEHLVVTNYDEDHIKDLPCLWKKIQIASLCRNPTISKDQMERLKRKGGPITPAMATLLKMMDNYPEAIGSGVLAILSSALGGSAYRELACNIPGVECVVFYNTYKTTFCDTNNISLVTFLYCEASGRKTCFLIPGDVETAGWHKLLVHPEFRERLKDVNIFVASHHGRETGYCEDLFGPELCSPCVVILSDGPIQHGTQEEMASRYERHATGTLFRWQVRKVLSTRRDGSIKWNSGTLW